MKHCQISRERKEFANVLVSRLGRVSRLRHNLLTLSVDAQQFDLEVQIGIGGDDPPGAAGAVAVVAGYAQHGLLPQGHPQHPLVPAAYDLPDPDRELERTAAIAARVEFFAVGRERSAAHACVVRRRVFVRNIREPRWKASPCNCEMDRDENGTNSLVVHCQLVALLGKIGAISRRDDFL